MKIMQESAEKLHLINKYCHSTPINQRTEIVNFFWHRGYMTTVVLCDQSAVLTVRTALCKESSNVSSRYKEPRI